MYTRSGFAGPSAVCDGLGQATLRADLRPSSATHRWLQSPKIEDENLGLTVLLCTVAQT